MITALECFVAEIFSSHGFGTASHFGKIPGGRLAERVRCGVERAIQTSPKTKTYFSEGDESIEYDILQMRAEGNSRTITTKGTKVHKGKQS
jgi:hypothetical protein